MKNFLALCLLLVTFVIAADNPLNIPEYTRNIKITFPSPEAAKEAKLSIAPLYENKKLAFSSRWDDNTPKHLKMSQILKKHGYKGTFFITGPKEDYCRKVLDGIIANGSSIGSHTMTHACMPNLNPNSAFKQCMENRILLESRTNSPVITFVLPGCADNLWIGPDPRTTPRIGKILQRCGFIGSPEFPTKLAKRYKLPEDTYFSTYLFAPGDRNPLPEKFDKTLAHRLKMMKNDKTHDQPHVTLGLHTKHTEEGFANLEKSLKKYANNPAWWYCEENEYCAYRYQYLHTKIKKIETKGNTVTYRITSNKPRSFGVKIPLTFLSSQPAAKVEFEGRNIAENTKMFNLPASSNQFIPLKIDLVQNPKNLPTKEALKESKKFPGIKTALTIDQANNKLRYILENQSPSQLQNITITFRLPMKWKNGIIRKELSNLPVGKEKIVELDMGSTNTDLESNEGTLYFAAETDFDNQAQSGRLYAVFQIEQAQKLTNAPRDNAKIMGPLLDNEEAKKYFKQISTINKPVKPLGTTINTKWLKTKVGRFTSPLHIAIMTNDRTWNLYKRKNVPEDNGILALLLQFNSPEKDKYRLFIKRKLFKSVYLNGNKISHNDFVKKYNMQLPLEKGQNRLIILLPYDKKHKRRIQPVVAIAKDDPRVNFLPCE